MKRLEYTRQSRKTHLQSKAAADVVMLLAQITFEKRRLEQERVSLQKRISRIDGRLSQIAGAETQLVPAIQAAPRPASQLAAPAAARELPAARPRIFSSGCAEMVVQY